MSEIHGSRIHITGVVQGVGFRPFVYGLAHRLALKGWVRNTSAGVDIEVDGTAEALQRFAQALSSEAPPLSRIDSIEIEARPADGFTAFEIVHSAPVEGAFQPISPDVSLCADCRRELLDPADRRYRYPFINCTNCGPRYTIIKDVPYDRPQTTMAPFPLCDLCAADYHDPLDRRFHAQPVACPECGPHVWLEGGEADGEVFGEEAIARCRALLAAGRIVAIKGLGGFHLACDATSETAVVDLRRRKLRVDKPFAVMMADLETIKDYCRVSNAEAVLLQSRERPIVILDRHPNSSLAAAIAPNQETVGVMLPYTPLHTLLLEAGTGFPPALVMTSGNMSEEPIAYTNEQARQRLATLADAFLLHNREIYVRCDDSVVRALEWGAGIDDRLEPEAPATYFLRRSRGYAPAPIRLPRQAPPLLAAGAELKNTFCLTRERYAFLSHHIGDLQNYETLQSYEEGIAHLEQLFRIRPQAIAYDLHPDYLATRYALERASAEQVPTVGVQHHHAHVAACMAEHGLAGERPLIGVSFDGTGYGEDEVVGPAIWGGEFLVADYTTFERLFHLAYVPLPGGDRAVREPWRVALAWLYQCGIPWDEVLPPLQFALAQDHSTLTGAKWLSMLHHQLERGLNAPLTSSMGRLFDAVSALAGVCPVVNYEAQAAIELEALVDPAESGAYPFAIGPATVDPAPLITAVVADVRDGAPPGQIAARFHNSVARMVRDVCLEIRTHSGLREVALSGGVWQNATLLNKTVPLLEKEHFAVYIHHHVPANDGGLALGQAAIAAATLL